MSDYRMEIKGQIGLSDYSNIYDYLGIVEDDDVFTIKFDNSNKHDIDIINSMLKGSSFNIKEERYDNLGNYYINTYKRK